MSGGHDEHGHHHREPESVLSLRVRALESLLVEKKLVSSEAVDRIVSAYEQDIGPHNGAKVVARAWVDPAYRARLLADGSAAIEELGFGGVDLQVVENTPGVHNMVVCAKSASTCPRTPRFESGTRAPSFATSYSRSARSEPSG
jgi:nitrile hydratase